MDGAKEDRVLVRALRPVFVDGIALTIGDQATMRREDAGLAVLGGKVEVLGRDADRLEIRPAAVWSIPGERTDQAPERSEWMARGDAPSIRPPATTVVELFKRWAAS